MGTGAIAPGRSASNTNSATSDTPPHHPSATEKKDRSPSPLGKKDRSQSPSGKKDGPPSLSGRSSPQAPSSPQVSSAPPTLSARRLKWSLQVNTLSLDTRKVVLKQLQSSQNNVAGFRTIQSTDNFAKIYAIGHEVMPSVHRGMEVRNAIKLEDGSHVVVKTRQKAVSFAHAKEETEWRQSTEFTLNLPKSGNIAEIIGVWEDKDTYYIVMEKVGGKDLFEVLDSDGQLPLFEAKAILRQLLKGVAAFHEQGCIHKDLKLENIMVERAPCAKNAELSPEPVVKLIDFDTVESWEPTSPKAKSVLGTDQYISQEAYAGKYSPASDIFAVGVIAYKLLTGTFPFNGRMFDDEPGENWVGSPKMKQIQDRVRRFHIDWTLTPFPTEPLALDLCRRMLAPHDNDRPHASEALGHPFLADTMSPKAPKKCNWD